MAAEEIRELALNLLEIARENLQADGTLLGIACIVTPGENLIVPTPFADEAEKDAVYGDVIAEARRRNALAIITVNDAYVGEPGDSEGYYPGKLAELGRSEAIVATISGPGFRSYELSLPYTRQAGEITFGELKEGLVSELSLLAGWAEQTPKKPQ